MNIYYENDGRPIAKKKFRKMPLDKLNNEINKLIKRDLWFQHFFPQKKKPDVDIKAKW